MAPADAYRIEEWRPGPASPDDDLAMLGDVLHAVVHAGAGVSFVVPFTREDGAAFFRDRVLPAVRAGTCQVLVARAAGSDRIVGTVQLCHAWPPNQPHRAEVAKLLVHPTWQRRGIARALMLALEGTAAAAGRTLLTLDTWTGGAAERLYRSLGWTVAGIIPRYARGSTTEALEPTTILYKELSRAPAAPVRHVVLLRWQPGTPHDAVRAIGAAFLRLRDQIPGIRAIEWGDDVSPEGRQAGHTHVFQVTFDSTADRDAYLPHPARRAFLADVLRPHVAGATVVDYVARDA